MITLGYCHICNCPVKAFAQDAGAMQKDCAHGYEHIVWFSPKTYQPDDIGESDA